MLCYFIMFAYKIVGIFYAYVPAPIIPDRPDLITYVTVNGFIITVVEKVYNCFDLINSCISIFIFFIFRTKHLTINFQYNDFYSEC